jgi:hypothetical protein
MIYKQKKKEDVFEFPKVLTVADLSTRWKMSRQAIHKKIQEDLLFPWPVQIVSNEKIKLFLFVDIEKYEKVRPWLLDVDYRQERQNWIYKNVIS